MRRCEKVVELSIGYFVAESVNSLEIAHTPRRVVVCC
jgi:hypothetical protein